MYQKESIWHDAAYGVAPLAKAGSGVNSQYLQPDILYCYCIVQTLKEECYPRAYYYTRWKMLIRLGFSPFLTPYACYAAAALPGAKTRTVM